MLFDIKKEQFVPILIILMFFWGLMHPLSKMVVADISPALMAFLRNAFGAATLFTLLFIKKNDFLVEKKDLPGLLLLGLCGTALSSLLLFTGLNLSTATNASILVNTNPIFVALLVPFLIQEKIGIRQLIGILLAFVGMVLVTTNGMPLNQIINSSYFTGNLFLIGSSLCLTFYTIYGKRYVEKYGGSIPAFYTVFVGALFLFSYNVITGEINNLATISPGGWLIVAYVGIVITGFIYAIWYKSIKFIGAARASSFKLLIPVFATISAIVLLGEMPTMHVLLGGGLVVAGLGFSQKIAFDWKKIKKDARKRVYEVME